MEPHKRADKALFMLKTEKRKHLDNQYFKRVFLIRPLTTQFETLCKSFDFSACFLKCNHIIISHNRRATRRRSQSSLRTITKISFDYFMSYRYIPIFEKF